MSKAVFLDRDGVINKNVENLVSVKQFEILDHVPEAIRKLNELGFLVIVVTNQPIIAKGFCTLKDVENLHITMRRILGASGAVIDDIYICPHHPERGFEGEVKELKIKCGCRKPMPGLIEKAINKHGICISESWLVGDNNVDILAAHNAGITNTILLSEQKSKSAAFSTLNILDAVNIISRKSY